MHYLLKGLEELTGLYHSIGKTSEPICHIVLILYYIHSSTIPDSPSSKKMYRAISITIDKKIL